MRVLDALESLVRYHDYLRSIRNGGEPPELTEARAAIKEAKEKQMGIIADTMAEVVERTKNTMEGAITDLRTATSIELARDGSGKVWINVDGICALRIQNCPTIVTPTGQLVV